MPSATWLHQNDLPASMSNTDVIHNYAVREIVALFHERNPTRPDDATDDTPNTTTEDAEANILDHHVPSPSPNVFDDIPKADATYRAISTNLLPHTRIPGMFLLEYRTFGGALAYQPCSKDIDLMGVFKALHPLDRNGDRLFKVAREWSCIVQALPGLPKEIRWVLATIYNFANEMLRPEHDEAALWRKRPWLLYWYTVADKLFEAYEIFATSPDADWFLRPTPVILKQEMSRETVGVLKRCRVPSSRPSTSHSDSSISTVIRNSPSPGASRLPLADEDGDSTFSTSALCAWLFGHTDWRDTVELNTEPFDPAPGGRVPTKRRKNCSQPIQAASSHAARLNPEATEFFSQRAHINKYSSTCASMCNATEDLFEACSDITMSDSPRSSSPLSSIDRDPWGDF